MKRNVLNLRDLGGIPLQDGKGKTPYGLYLRSGKLSALTPEECKKLCQEYHIACVIDLRTPIEAQEFPDPLPDGVEYKLISLLKDAAVGITHETGSDAMTIIRNLRKNPGKLKEMVPDFKALYKDVVTDEYCRSQLDKAVDILRKNAAEGKCTLFHCTAGKDRTGIVSMALLKSYGVADENIISDYMRTNRNAFWPTIKKCLGVLMLTHNWELVRICYTSFMAQRELIETAITYSYLCTRYGTAKNNRR
jgi:protein-tyrosine phosphatase